MSRRLRTYSNSKIYHIIFKGIDNQEIFYDDKDRKYFLNQLKQVKKLFEYDIYAYCLMGNHVHIVIRVEKEELSKVVKNFIIRYVAYFNRKYERKGPLVQDRFKSKNVENLNYFLKVCRYVHRNPENAGMEKTSDYKWSSYKEYIGTPYLINKSVLLHYFNDDINDFIKYTNKVNDISDILDVSEYEILGRLNDSEVMEIIMKQFKLNSEEEVAIFFKNKSIEEKKKCIEELKKIKGTNITQLSRITRLSRNLFK